MSRYQIVRWILIVGAAVVLVIVIGPAVIKQAQEASRSLTEVVCYVGSEKADFLHNEEIVEILADDYDLKVAFTKMGSIDQATGDTSSVDCLWPSNTSALEIYKELHPAESVKHEIIFNSPIVLYSWRPVVDALIDQGVVSQSGEGYYTVDTAWLVEIITSEDTATWQDLGVSELYGDVNIITTDPVRSNSGNMFYGLLANMLAGGQPATLEMMEENLPSIAAYYDSQGYMEESSGVLFDRFISTGMGANPLIANYESLLIEFLLANDAQLDVIQNEIKMIYPMPTVWSSHPLIAKTEAGERLLEAMKDENIQQIAWEQHGFRSGLTGVQNDPAVFNLSGVAAEVQSVMQLPRADAMLRLVEYLGE